MSRYRVCPASVEETGLNLGAPRAYARTLAEALALSADTQYHGPEGAAVVTPRGRAIYSDAEYRAAEIRAAEKKRSAIAAAAAELRRDMCMLQLAFPRSIIPAHLRDAAEEKFLRVVDSVGVRRPASYK